MPCYEIELVDAYEPSNDEVELTFIAGMVDYDLLYVRRVCVIFHNFSDMSTRQ